MSKRIERVNELMKREVNELLLKECDFPENCFVTVTRAQTSPDLRISKIFISILSPKEEERIFAYLKSQVFEIQQKINRKLRIRPVPKIVFVKEEKTEEAARVEEILKNLKNKEK